VSGSDTTGKLRFGNSVLDEALGVVVRPDGTETQLRPKTLEMLRVLLDRPGLALTREEILDAVWPGIHVTEDSVTQCVGEIRRAIGPDGAEVLRTLPRRGYVLDAPVQRLGPPAAPRRGGGAVAAIPPDVPVVAVLPFSTLQPDPMLAVFAEGVLEGVVGALATLREPVVISANSTRHFADATRDLPAIARRLGARYVATGSVRGSRDQLRLSVELVEGERGAVLWQRSYDVSDAAMFETQDRLAAAIANTLAPRVRETELRRLLRRRPEDVGAYHLLLEARQLFLKLDRPTFEIAGELLRRAATIDPGFPPVHAEMAAWLSLRLGQGWSADPAADSKALDAAAQAAIALDADNARALSLLGHNHTVLRRRYSDAIGLLDRALKAAPNDAEAWMWSSPTFAWMGQAQEAVWRAERAIGLSPEDPLLFRYEHFRSIAHYVGGEYVEAVHWGQRSLEGNPHYTSSLRMTAAALSALGRMDEARALSRRVIALQPGFGVKAFIERQPLRDDNARERYGRHLVEAGLPP
jgi:TolB-like protein/Tfp pilus assembly protein PilF